MRSAGTRGASALGRSGPGPGQPSLEPRSPNSYPRLAREVALPSSGSGSRGLRGLRRSRFPCSLQRPRALRNRRSTLRRLGVARPASASAAPWHVRPKFLLEPRGAGRACPEAQGRQRPRRDPFGRRFACKSLKKGRSRDAPLDTANLSLQAPFWRDKAGRIETQVWNRRQN